MARIETISLANLLVNTENYRFEPVESQKEAIDLMVQDQEDKLFHLAEDILQNGQNPTDFVQVAKSNHDKTKFIILEGNRRIVALKLLNTPDLVDDKKYSYLKTKFKKLHQDNKDKIPSEVDCVVFDSPSEADKWIKLKHAGEQEGVGTVRWNAQQIQRFEEKVEGTSSIALQAINLLDSAPTVPKDLKKELRNIKVTNLDSLLSDPDVRKTLGIDIKHGKLQAELEEDEVVKGLTQVFKDLLDPNFGVKRIYTKEDREDYISKFPKASTPDQNKKSSAPWEFGKAKRLSS